MDIRLLRCNCRHDYSVFNFDRVEILFLASGVHVCTDSLLSDATGPTWFQLNEKLPFAPPSHLWHLLIILTLPVVFIIDLVMVFTALLLAGLRLFHQQDCLFRLYSRLFTVHFRINDRLCKLGHRILIGRLSLLGLQEYVPIVLRGSCER